MSDHSVTEAKGAKEPILKLVLELGPLMIFFLLNSRGGDILGASPALKATFGEPIFLATGAFMLAVVISLVVSKLALKKIAIMPLVSGVFVIVFGALTLYLQDDLFIKIKPTLINIIWASLLFGGLYFGILFLKFVFGEVFEITDEGWRVLTIRWACFFLFLAVLNEIVWRSFSTDFWVSFKVFGIFPLTLAFGMFQFGILKKYAPTKP